MTLDEFLKKYNRCPFCLEYSSQHVCGDCRYFLPLGEYKTKLDLFRPNDDWIEMINRRVTE